MSDSKQKNNNSSLNWLIQGSNWGALFIMVAAMLLLLYIMAKIFLKDTENNAPKKIEISYTLKVDSNQLKNYKDSLSSEFDELISQNNQKVISEVDNSIKQQYQRMESILSVQEDKSKLFTYVAGFIAILVALATFFGFKSINEMKKSTIESAEYKATRVSEEVAVEKTKERVQQLLVDIKKEITLEIKTGFKSDFERKELIVSDDFRNEMLKIIEKSFNNFDERILELEANNLYSVSKSEGEETHLQPNDIVNTESLKDETNNSDETIDTDLFNDGNK